MTEEIKKYLSGEELYGDKFTQDEIDKWYSDEKEAYADLAGVPKTYPYHALNKLYGFNKIDKIKFTSALGFGSSFGNEFDLIIDKIDDLTIIEPSDKQISAKIGHLIPKYVKPTSSGKLPFSDNQFDLITCFGVLHHIPNVSYVVSELIRVLKPDGILLIREPITSMGDWRYKRLGLTARERGISTNVFERIFAKYPVNVKRDYCMTMTPFLQRKFGNFFTNSILSYQGYLILDKYLSRVMKLNCHYHPTNIFQRIAPQCVFYRIEKFNI